MAGFERWRETVTEMPTAEEVRRRAEEGWQPVAIEWRRAAPAAGESVRETPYGLVTRDGGFELRPDPVEEEALRLMLTMVIDDRNSLARVAEELNRRGLTTRRGESWSQSAVFNMLPRLIEMAPRFFGATEWPAASTLTH